MDFADIAGKYLQNRWDQATQPFDDPEGYLNRRLGIDEEGNVKPRSTTINYNDDGTQTVTTKHDVTPPSYQQSAGGNFQPQPGYNFQMPQAQTPPVQAIEPVQAPVAQPTPAAAPVAPTQPQMMPAGSTNAPFARPLPDTSGVGAGQEIPSGQIPQPIMDDSGRVVGYETPNQTMAALQNKTPFVPQQQPTQQEPTQPVAPAPAPAVQPTPAATPVNAVAPNAVPPVTAPAPAAAPEAQPNQWQQNIEGAKDDKVKLAALAANADTPEEVRKLAFEQLQKIAEKERQTTDAGKLIDQAMKGEPQAVSDLTRHLKKQNEEGSYIKAYLMHRLGLHELGKQEEQKLGGGVNIEGMMGADGHRYTAEVGPQGVVRAWNAEGRAVDDKTLAALNSSALTTKGIGHAGATRIRDSQGVEWSQVPTTRGTVFVDSSGRPGVPTGRTTPITAGSDVVLQQALTHNKAVQEAIVKYGVDSVMKEGMQFMNPITGEFSPVQKGGYNPYGTKEEPKKEVPTTSAGKQKVSFEGTATPGMMNAVAPVVPGEQPTMTNAVYNPNQGGMTTAGYNPNEEAPVMMKTGTANLENQRKLELKGGETGIEVGGKRSESYNKHLDTEVVGEANKGYEVSRERKKQFGILTRPGVNTDQIFGLYNSAGEDPGNQKLSIIRDIIGGVFKEPKDVSDRLAQLNLDPATRSALEEYNISNAAINRATLKATAGAGSVSDAEQEANRKSNVDPTKIPALGGFNSMAQSQFNGDLAQYKGDWALDQKATNVLQLEKAWRKESARMSSIYRDIAEQRIKYINENGNSTAAVKEGYKRFPIPEYDPQSGTWKKTKPLSQILGK